MKCYRAPLTLILTSLHSKTSEEIVYVYSKKKICPSGLKSHRECLGAQVSPLDIS